MKNLHSIRKPYSDYVLSALWSHGEYLIKNSLPPRKVYIRNDKIFKADTPWEALFCTTPFRHRERWEKEGRPDYAHHKIIIL